MRSLRSVLVGAGIAVLVVVALSLIDFWDFLPNPFERSTVDRSAPALLERLEDLSEYRAASAQLQVLIDVEEDTRFVPSIISGERTTFLAFGSVDAVVDFSTLAAGAVVVDDDRTSVTVRLPRATIDDVKIDPEQSRVLDRERGVLDRLGSVFSDSPTSERGLYLLSQDKLRRAASTSGLRERAEVNTKRMLTALFRSLGFTEISISYGAAGTRG